MSQTLSLSRSEEIPALLERIDAITPLLKEAGAANEQHARLTDEVVAALHDSRVFRLTVPRELGGYEASPLQTLEVLERLAYADGSTGWAVLAVGLVSGQTAALLAESGARQLFGEDKYTVIAGQGTRPGTARRVDGGYLLSGQWQFASGMHLSSHTHSGGLVEGTNEYLIFTVPREQATFVDNWDVTGLRATGSIDYRMEEVFVPEDHTFSPVMAEPVTGGAVYLLGLPNTVTLIHQAWALGMSRRLLEEMRAIAHKKSGTPQNSIDSAEYYAEYARAEAKYRAARALIREFWTEAEETLLRGERLTEEQEDSTILALNHVTAVMLEISGFVYKWAGTAALRRGDLQRVIADARAGAQHVTSSPQLLHSVGKRVAGFAPDTFWAFFQLAPKG